MRSAIVRFGGVVALAAIAAACAGVPAGPTISNGRPVAAKGKSPSPTSRASATVRPSAVPSLGLLLEGKVTIEPGTLLDRHLAETTAGGVRLISNNGAGIISDNGLGLISDNGLGLISDNGSSYRIAATGDGLAPVEGMWVKAIDLYDGKLLAGPVATKADGSYKLGFVKVPAKNMRVVAVVPGQEADAETTYTTLVPPSPAPVITSDTTRLVAAMMLDVLPTVMQPVIDAAKVVPRPSANPDQEQVILDLEDLLLRIGPSRLTELDKDGAVARGLSDRLLATADLSLPVFKALYDATEEARAFAATIQPAPSKAFVDDVIKYTRRKNDNPKAVAMLVSAGMAEAKATDLVSRLKTASDGVAQVLLLSLVGNEKAIYAPLEAEAK